MGGWSVYAPLHIRGSRPRVAEAAAASSYVGLSLSLWGLSAVRTMHECKNVEREHRWKEGICEDSGASSLKMIRVV